VLVLGFIALAVFLRGSNSGASLDSAVARAVVTAQQTLAGQMEQRLMTSDSSIAQQVAQIGQVLTGLQEKTAEIEAERLNAIGKLAQATGDTKAAVERLNAETANLSGALSSNQTRGKWGEMSLRRLVESVGMQEHVDFVEQRQEFGEGTGRPDLHINLPGGRVLYVDSKVPWDDYQRYVSEPDEALAAGHLANHIKAVRGHIDALAKRDYARAAESLDYVIMYIPVEPALGIALSTDQGLLEYAAKKNVVLTGPLSLIVTLNNFQRSWDDDAKVRNVDAIITATDELMSRVRVMVDHMAKVGEFIGKAGGAFNSAAKSYNSRVVPQSATIDKLREKSMTLADVPETNFDPVAFKTAANAPRPDYVEEIRLDDPLA
jgi:DNA recombination protein RmuC